MNWEIGIDIYTLLILCVRWITNENLLRRLYTVFCGDLNGKEILLKEKMYDSFHCTVENNTAL